MLAVTSLAVLLVLLDVTIVHVAFPDFPAVPPAGLGRRVLARGPGPHGLRGVVTALCGAVVGVRPRPVPLEVPA